LSIDLRRFLNFLVLFNISFLLNLTRNLARTYIFIIMGFGIDFFFLSNFSASFFGCIFFCILASILHCLPINDALRVIHIVTGCIISSFIVAKGLLLSIVIGSFCGIFCGILLIFSSRLYSLNVLVYTSFASIISAITSSYVLNYFFS
jgi:hypothetical protein